MPLTPQGFAEKLVTLRRDLAAQGDRVRAMIEASFEALFAGDQSRALAAIAQDDAVDRADVEIERGCVRLLTEATNEHARLEPEQLRAVLVTVKVNNELERVADAATAIAQRVAPLRAAGVRVPDTFRVMTNSVVGILRDASHAYERSDAGLARVVLQSEDAVEAFKDALLRDAEEKVAKGTMGVELAFNLHEVANQCVRMADYCTNIAEQVIYAVSGAIVRHLPGHWVELPKAADAKPDVKAG